MWTTSYILNKMDSGDHIIHTKQHNQWGPYHTKEYDMGPKYTQTLKEKN